jgi:hypothetical protein
VTYALSIAVRLALFALSLLLLESGGQTLLTSGLTFAGDMSTRELTALLSWSAGYVVLGVVALFTAFKLGWLRSRTALLIAVAGAGVSAWNALAVTCPAVGPSQASFLLLSCIAHPVEYAGLAVAALLAGSIWLRHESE